MKCKQCEGKGMIGLGVGIRGVTKCPVCNGKGEVPDNSTTKVAVIFDRWFIAPDELNEFCQSIGYENPGTQTTLI